MKPAWRRAFQLWISLLVTGWTLSTTPLLGEPVPLKRVVELALAHGTAMAAATADERRALASYNEAHNQYLPQMAVGSGLGASWGFPLSLEGSAPSLFNLNSQAALLNPALREFTRAAKTDWQAAGSQTQDQRAQTIQDTVLAYLELNQWESMLGHLQQEQAEATTMEEIVNQRLQAGVEGPQALDQARLSVARVRYRTAQAQGSIDVLRNRLAQLTGLPAASIETTTDSIPTLPEVKQEDDLAGKAAQSSPAVRSAEERATAQDFRARGEHRALLPTFDFAAQYAVLATFNHYDQYFQPNSFRRNNATVGVVIRFPFLNFSQRARAQAADAEAVKAHKDAESAKERVSDETLRLQRSVQQLAAAQEVSRLEYQLAEGGAAAAQVKLDAGTANLHDLDDARNQANEHYYSLQNASFELERSRIALLRATGDLEGWLGISK